MCPSGCFGIAGKSVTFSSKIKVECADVHL